MMKRLSMIALPLPLVLIACAQEEEVPVATEMEAETVADAAVLTPADRSLADATQEGPIAQAVVEPMPPALHGRWGLTPADCEPGRSDAKGLLTIAGDGLRFYESRAAVQRIVSQETDQIHATFDFTGEGREWRKGMMLDLDDGELVRRDFDKTGAQTLRYEKCR